MNNEPTLQQIEPTVETEEEMRKRKERAFIISQGFSSSVYQNAVIRPGAGKNILH